MSRRLRELAALARVGKEPGPRNLESKHVYYSFFVKSGKIVGQGCENAFHITRSFTPTVKCVLATRQLCINQFAVVVRPLNFIFNPLSSVWPSETDGPRLTECRLTIIHTAVTRAFHQWGRSVVKFHWFCVAEVSVKSVF